MDIGKRAWLISKMSILLYFVSSTKQCCAFFILVASHVYNSQVRNMKRGQVQGAHNLPPLHLCLCIRCRDWMSRCFLSWSLEGPHCHRRIAAPWVSKSSLWLRVLFVKSWIGVSNQSWSPHQSLWVSLRVGWLMIKMMVKTARDIWVSPIFTFVFKHSYR